MKEYNLYNTKKGYGKSNKHNAYTRSDHSGLKYETKYNKSDFTLNMSYNAHEKYSKSDSFDLLCEYCNDYGDSYCPHHSSLYSTDEACSSKADSCSNAYKAKDGKQKKRGKEVKGTSS